MRGIAAFVFLKKVVDKGGEYGKVFLIVKAVGRHIAVPDKKFLVFFP